MTSGQIRLFISDIRSVSRIPVLLIALISPVIITLFLLYIFPLLSGTAAEDDSFSYTRFYSIASITLISAIPIIYGLLFSFVHKGTIDPSAGGRSVRCAGNAVILRMSFSAFLSFIVILPVIYLTDAVSTEGWLRSIFAAFLLALTGPLIFLITISVSAMRRKREVISLICLIFLITVPSGLLLHHPWNYFIFFSPLYWSCWAWVIASPAESLIYGIISAALTVTGISICYIIFPWRSSAA